MNEHLPTSSTSPELSHLDDSDLVESYLNGELSGRPVMGRLLQKLDVSAEQIEAVLQAPLSRRDGTPLTDEATGEQLRFGDYLDGPAEQHGAQAPLLGFVQLDSSHPQFPQMRDAVRAMVESYAGMPLEQTN